MESNRTNFQPGSKTKKSQKEKTEDFRTRHHRVEVTFKKALHGDPDSENSEYGILMRNAAPYSRNLTKYIKACALEPRQKVTEKQPLINQKMLLEIHKIGVNINQMAYKVNAKVDEKEIREFGENLIELAKMLDEILVIIRSK